LHRTNHNTIGVFAREARFGNDVGHELYLLLMSEKLTTITGYDCHLERPLSRFIAVCSDMSSRTIVTTLFGLLHLGAASRIEYIAVWML
ncbi:MAG: hypothetical protein N2C12_03785, partial [Planctomycetales bacterium]